MSDQNRRPRLQIVKTLYRVPITAEEFLEPGLQHSLFPRSKPGLLIFVFFPDVTEQEFRDTVEYSEPSWVLELRTAPRFDIGQLNRREAFQVFEHHRSRYIDLTSALMGKGDGGKLISSVAQFLQNKNPTFDRPLMFLMDRSESDHLFTRQILDTVKGFNSATSEVCEVPRFVESLKSGHQ